jgi:hypothetical protein
MVVNNSGLSAGPASNAFSITEDDPNNDDSILSGITGTVDVNGVLSASWTISQVDFNKCLDGNSELADSTTDFIFDVSGYSSYNSPKLNISNDTLDDPFTIEIQNPPCGSKFNVNEDFDISINATDNDDTIDGTVKIFNTSGEIFSQSITNGFLTITKKFVFPSVYKIVANGTNNDGDKARAIINIVVMDTAINGKYVAACIDEPKDFSFISTDKVGKVKFNASGTKAWNMSAGLASPIPITNLNFSWKFSDGRENPYHDGNNATSYEFTKIFVPVKDNWGTLDVKLKV